MDNNNNLFTNMFGVESEETPTTEPPKPVEQPTFEQPVEQSPLNQQPVTFSSMQPTPVEIVTPIQPKEEEMVYLDSTPINNPAPIQTPQIPLDQPVTNNIHNEINFDDAEKPSPVLIILLIIVMIGGGLYMFATTFSSPTPKSPTKPTTNQPATTVPEKEEEKEEEKPAPPAVTSFDITLNFDKGYTTNEKELNQTASYQPEQTEGVIKCETIKDRNIPGLTNKESVYLYYKDAAVKKVITISDGKYLSQKTYNTYLTSFKALKSESSKYENLIVDYKANNSTLKINAKVYVDLVYGHNFKFDDTDYIYRIGVTYNTPIKAAMDKMFFNQDYKNNMKCSTILTN